MDDINNSMIDEDNPLAVEHARVMQAIQSARDVLHIGLTRYKERGTDTSNQLWRLYETCITTRRLLNDLLGIDNGPIIKKDNED